ncbi:hypothetical protein C7T94_02265 [Pedobacter yulinensis]|uniref:DNA-directed RNA polymerase subunit delta n=1 Tax=Pedobacter yulinensis TaxID=2126353 RepID=A0A2T3HR77_9SPHI|nr:S-adenosyl-l-methionine hydroxide adenosyltransferase family protein [Pedobacter yulinensis]PST84965.1 hypothetical protein C7T94_02265 [Pedobacter yulinensis]
MKKLFCIALLCLSLSSAKAQKPIVVIQTDFGLKDGAVPAMKGVAAGVSADLRIYDLTHEIPAYNVWEASYRLYQTIEYWPKGTVFVSVVDPGVGTARKSVVLQTKTGHFIVTPDNGTLTLVADAFGIAALREIDEAVNRRLGSGSSYTFHGRDVYAYTAARLASGLISFTEVGARLPDTVVRLPYQKAELENGMLYGSIPILDIQYGNVWTNIDAELLKQAGIRYGDHIKVRILSKGKTVYRGMVPFVETFGAAREGAPLAYLNSLMQLAFALNRGSFADSFHIKSGQDWQVIIEKERK